MTWAPNGCEAQLQWKAVKPQPVSTSNTALGVAVVSDTPISGFLVSPPPVTGDNARVCALNDWLYNLNLQIYNDNFYPTTGDDITPPTLTKGLGLIYQALSAEGPTTAADWDTETSNAARNIMNSAYRTDMHLGDTALIMVGEGLPASTVVGTIEIVVGVEYIADTRVIGFGGGGGRARRPNGTPSQQMDSHSRAVALAQMAPASRVGGDGVDVASTVQSMIKTVEAGVSTGIKVAGAISDAMPMIESVLAMF